MNKNKSTVKMISTYTLEEIEAMLGIERKFIGGAHHMYWKPLERFGNNKLYSAMIDNVCGKTFEVLEDTHKSDGYIEVKDCPYYIPSWIVSKYGI